MKSGYSYGESRRKKYEEIIGLQQTASIMRSEYLDKYNDLQCKKTSRKTTLNHVKELMNDVTTLPSLDQVLANPEMLNKNYQWIHKVT